MDSVLHLLSNWDRVNKRCCYIHQINHYPVENYWTEVCLMDNAIYLLSNWRLFFLIALSSVTISSIISVVVNFLFQLIFIFPLFWGMVMYANEFKTKEKQKLTEIKN